jgi:hypothetical protein
MPCSYERYMYELKFRNPAVRTRSLVLVLVAELCALVPAIFVRRLYPYEFPLQVAVFCLNFFLARHWNIKYWSKMKGRQVHGMMEVAEILIEERVSRLLAFFEPDDPQLTSDQISIEIGHAEHQLQDASRASLTIPSWLVPAASMLASAAIAAVGKESSREQWTVLGVGLVTVVFSFGIYLIGSALPSRRVHLANYLALLRRAKRRLDLEALEQAAITQVPQRPRPASPNHVRSSVLEGRSALEQTGRPETADRRS